jgi:hypothetical protein
VKWLRDSSLFSDRPVASGLIHAATSPDPPTAALRYLAPGFSAIPLRGKVPAVTWREYQQRQPTRAELQRWARRGLFGNVGIVCGEVSGSLVVLDFDAQEAYDAFRARFPDLAQTYTVATGGGGWHVYLRADALPPSRRGQGVELCADGRQVVAPPSVHPNGSPYRVEQPFAIRRVPGLSEVVQWMDSLARPARVRQPGVAHRHASRTATNPALVAAIADTLRARGYRQKGDWLNGPCIYSQRHAHGDAKRSFGFNTRTGYGWCFTCQRSMLAKEIAQTLTLIPADGGGGLSAR